MTAPPEVTVIDVPALRAALETVKKHEVLLRARIAHEAEGATFIQPSEIYDAFGSALHALVEDEWRPDEHIGPAEPFQREYDDEELEAP